MHNFCVFDSFFASQINFDQSECLQKYLGTRHNHLPCCSFDSLRSIAEMTALEPCIRMPSMTDKSFQKRQQGKS